MTQESTPHLRQIEGGKQEPLHEPDVLNSVYEAWLVRTGADDELIDNELHRLFSSQVDDQETTLQAATAFVDGYVAMIALEHADVCSDELVLFRLGQKTLEKYLKERIDQGEDVSIDGIIEAVGRGFQEAAKNKPVLKLVEPEEVEDHQGMPKPQAIRRGPRVRRRYPGVDLGEGTDDESTLKRLTNHDLLSPEEEFRLAIRARDGDKDAKAELILHNLRLVASLAWPKLNHGLNLNELIQEGVIGLNRAVEKFDTDKGFRFTTYATYWVNQAMQRAIQNQGLAIRLPIHAHNQLREIKKEERRALEETGTTLTDQELADRTGIDPEQIISVRRAFIRARSLDAPLAEDSEATYGAFIPDPTVDVENTAIDNVYNSSIVEIVNQLDEPYALLVKMRFGLEGEDTHTLEQIGNKTGVTREAVRQSLEKALRSLRELIEQQEALQPLQVAEETRIDELVPKLPDIPDEAETSEEVPVEQKKTFCRPVAKRVQPQSADIEFEDGVVYADARQRNLALANRKRIPAVRLKEEIKTGIVSPLSGLLDPRAERVQVQQILRCIPGIGKVKRDKILNNANINPRTQTGALSEEEIERIISLLPKKPYKRSGSQPTRDPEKLKKSLERANEIRLHWAKVKAQLKKEQLGIEEAFKDELVSEMKVVDLVSSLPFRSHTRRGGKHTSAFTTVESIMSEADLPANVRINKLTKNQKKRLDAALRKRGYIS
ncbi:MAG TPA: sigma-70 family RNA polymerase sigma factor [Candidatus Sulfotelmatobacter sp.]|nr:sigma-70 family RNA polymerase sigma factor [Candidatus Sulfotelmatobacter sp.]